MGWQVYLMCFNGRDAEPLGPVKIGFTGNLAKREKAIQTTSPKPVITLAEFRVPERWIARVWESLLHKHFADKRMAGEWFDLDPLYAMAESCRVLRVHLQAQAPVPPPHPDFDEIVQNTMIPEYERVGRVLKAWRHYYSENSNVRAIA
jgi:hypothetical protein